LAGIGAFLHGRKIGDISVLRRFTGSRELILVGLELTVPRVAWNFNLDCAPCGLAGVERIGRGR
jgi:uncharacterized membrane protein